MHVDHHPSITQDILELLGNEHLRLTPISLEREICKRRQNTSRKSVRNAIKELVAQGVLAYTQHFSTTHLELNFNRPVLVSERIVLCPINFTCASNPEKIVIKLNDGTSFGAGDHPTTRLMLRGMDRILRTDSEKDFPFRRALDIGTGSGVLAIAASYLGVNRVEGVDIDPLACHDAYRNVHLNGLNASVNISDKSLDDFSSGQFDLVLANLRPPTVSELLPAIQSVSSQNSVLIISGCREEEKIRLEKRANFKMWKTIWEDSQNGWSSFAVRRLN